MYRHTQIGFVILIAIAAGALLPAYVLVRPSAGVGAAEKVLCAGVLLVLLAAAVCFGSLTVAVDAKSLKWSLGIGLIRKSIALDEIADAEAGRVPALAGWGIRITPGGLLYNVSGFGMVEVVLRDGKMIMIGSDEPDRLARSIREAAGIFRSAEEE